MTILYFTSTGNCLYVAKELGGKNVSIKSLIKEKRFNVADDKIGIVFPVFALCVPLYIKEFLLKAKFSCKYLFAVITYGDIKGAAAEDLIKMTKECGISFNYISYIKMTENFLPKYEMLEEKEKTDLNAEKASLQKIKSDIEKEANLLPKSSAWDKFLTNAHKKFYPFPIGNGVSEQIYVTSDCSNCKICEKVCPTDNIKIREGKPIFGDCCLSCLSCVQNCPKIAMHMKSEKGEARYRNRNVTVDEIINANN